MTFTITREDPPPPPPLKSVTITLTAEEVRAVARDYDCALPAPSLMSLVCFCKQVVREV